jgi:hypothetical protein
MGKMGRGEGEGERGRGGREGGRERGKELSFKLVGYFTPYAIG